MINTLKYIAFILILLMSKNVLSKGIEFKNISFDEAMVISQTEGKPLFIDFYTTWCGPCKYLTKKVFIDESLGNYYSTNFISIKIDGDSPEGIELKNKHRISAFPTMLFLNDENQLLKKVIGVRDASQLLQIGHLVLNPESTDLFKMNEAYNQGQRDSKFIVEYIRELKKNHFPTLLISQEFIKHEKLNLTDQNDIIILIDAHVGLENKYTQVLFADINKYTRLFPELMKELVLNISLDIYEESVNDRDIKIINNKIPELIEAYKTAVDKKATSENLVSKLNELYQFRI